MRMMHSVHSIKASDIVAPLFCTSSRFPQSFMADWSLILDKTELTCVHTFLGRTEQGPGHPGLANAQNCPGLLGRKRLTPCTKA